MTSKKKEAPPAWFNPALQNVITSPDIFTKLHPTIIEKLRRLLVNNEHHTRPQGRKKWEEILTLEGTRYALDCHPDIDGKIMITGARQAHKSR